MTKDCSWNYHENYKHRTSAWADCSFHGNSMNNLSLYCGLIDAKIRASDKDLPVSNEGSNFKKKITLKVVIELVKHGHFLTNY